MILISRYRDLLSLTDILTLECRECGHTLEEVIYPGESWCGSQCPACKEREQKFFNNMNNHIASLAEEAEPMEYQMSNTSIPVCEHFNNEFLGCGYSSFITDCPPHCHQGDCKHQ